MRFEKRHQRRLQENCIPTPARMDRLCCANDNTLGDIEALKDSTAQPSAISTPKSSPEPFEYSISTKTTNRASHFARAYSTQVINNRPRANQDNGIERYSGGCPLVKHSPAQQCTQQVYNGEMTDNRAPMNLNKMESCQAFDGLERGTLQSAFRSKGGLGRHDDYGESQVMLQVVSSLHQNHTPSGDDHGSPDMFVLECPMENPDNEARVPKRKLRRPTRKHQENPHSGTASKAIQAYTTQKSPKPRRLPVDELVLIADRALPFVGEESGCGPLDLYDDPVGPSDRASLHPNITKAQLGDPILRKRYKSRTKPSEVCDMRVASISLSRFQLPTYVDLSPNSRRLLKTSLKCSDGFEGQELRPAGKPMPVRRHKNRKQTYKHTKRMGELVIVSSRTFGDDAEFHKNIEGFSVSMIAREGRHEHCNIVSKNLRRIEDREGGIQRKGKHEGSGLTAAEPSAICKRGANQDLEEASTLPPSRRVNFKDVETLQALSMVSAPIMDANSDDGCSSGVEDATDEEGYFDSATSDKTNYSGDNGEDETTEGSEAGKGSDDESENGESVGGKLSEVSLECGEVASLRTHSEGISELMEEAESRNTESGACCDEIIIDDCAYTVKHRMSDYESLVTPNAIGNSYDTSFFVESLNEQQILHASLELGSPHWSPPKSQRKALLSDEIRRYHRCHVFESNSYFSRASATLRNHSGTYKLSRSKSMPSYISAVEKNDRILVGDMALSRVFRKTVFSQERPISRARIRSHQEINLKRMTRMLSTEFGTNPARGRVQSLPFKPLFNGV